MWSANVSWRVNTLGQALTSLPKKKSIAPDKLKRPPKLKQGPRGQSCRLVTIPFPIMACLSFSHSLCDNPLCRHPIWSLLAYYQCWLSYIDTSCGSPLLGWYCKPMHSVQNAIFTFPAVSAYSHSSPVLEVIRRHSIDIGTSSTILRIIIAPKMTYRTCTSLVWCRFISLAVAQHFVWSHSIADWKRVWYSSETRRTILVM